MPYGRGILLLPFHLALLPKDGRRSSHLLSNMGPSCVKHAPEVWVQSTPACCCTAAVRRRAVIVGRAAASKSRAPADVCRASERPILVCGLVVMVGQVLDSGVHVKVFADGQRSPNVQKDVAAEPDLIRGIIEARPGIAEGEGSAEPHRPEVGQSRIARFARSARELVSV